MHQDLRKHHTTNPFSLSWRFDDNPQPLSQITVLDEELNSSICKALNDDSLIEMYSLNAKSIANFESRNFQDEQEWITARLQQLKDQSDKVLILWSSWELIETTMINFSNNFEDFFYPISDDIFIINIKQNWIVYISHFEMFQYGELVKSPRLTSAIGNGG